MLQPKIQEIIQHEINEIKNSDREEKDNLLSLYQGAIDKVEKALSSGLRPDVIEAQKAVKKLPKGESKKALREELKKIPYREPLKSLSELYEQGLFIIDEGVTVENRIMEILEEKQLRVSDLAKLTGISQQNITQVIKKKMKPGIDFALKVSYVLSVPVEELFTLTKEAWVKPYKLGRDITLYINVVTYMIMDSTAKKEEIEKSGGHEYYDTETKTYLTKKEYEKIQQAYLKEKLDEKVKELKQEENDLSSTKLIAQAKEELRQEFNQRYVKIYQKLGKSFVPYVINSKKVVGKS